MSLDDYDGQIIFGEPWEPKASWQFSNRWEKPRKTSPRKLVPTGDRTRARCMTGAHATPCYTAVTTSLEFDGRHFWQILWGSVAKKYFKNKTPYKIISLNYYRTLHLELQDVMEPSKDTSYHRFRFSQYNTHLWPLRHLYCIIFNPIIL